MVATVPAVTPTAATVATPTVIPIVAPAAAPVIYIRKNRFNGTRVDEGELHAVVRYSKLDEPWWAINIIFHVKSTPHAIILHVSKGLAVSNKYVSYLQLLLLQPLPQQLHQQLPLPPPMMLSPMMPAKASPGRPGAELVLPVLPLDRPPAPHRRVDPAPGPSRC